MKNYYDKQWLALKEEVDSRGANGSAVVEALQDYYSIFDDGILDWLGGLFDPDIGGFYYSESARDNEYISYNGVDYLLLPDIESTSQATNYLQANGIFKTWSDFPQWMIDKMARFICERQDPETGFFYHPQWPKELTDSKPSRRGRDHMWAVHMAEKYGFKLPYPTASERLEQAVKTGEKPASLPDYLLSEQAFKKYLADLDWDTNAYWSGNLIAAQVNVINSAGLGKTAVDFLNSVQKPDTGLWGIYGGYSAINAYLKISCVYEAAGFPIPNIDRAASAIIACGTTDEIPSTTCFQYNVWLSARNVLANLRRFGGADGERRAKEITATLLNEAPDAIVATKEKALIFRKPKGCFSMAPNESSGTSQGMPVAIFHTNEGDVNANGICSSGTANNLYAALDLEAFRVPIFSPNAKEVFMSALRLPK